MKIHEKKRSQKQIRKSKENQHNTRKKNTKKTKEKKIKAMTIKETGGKAITNKKKQWKVRKAMKINNKNKIKEKQWKSF